MAKNILVTDDALFMRVALKNILVAGGYGVFEARNGEEAIELYQRLHPDLVIMDLMMPVMDGITAIKRLHEIDPRAKCIVSSGLGQKGMVLKALEAGAKDYLTRPFRADQILQGVRQQIGS